jgi:hypothetical protein
LGRKNYHHFGQEEVKRLSSSSKQQRIAGDILIDDDPIAERDSAAVTSSFNVVPNWKHVLLDRPWNQ